MYTQCPECQTAFRVTAQVLQQAGGRVRCGGCSSAFSAIDYLSEEMPQRKPRPQQRAGSVDDAYELPTDEEFAKQSTALLETLDKLAGPDEVRIEDTGVEWRVVDENEAVAAGDAKDSDESVRWYMDDAEGELDDVNKEFDPENSETASLPQLNEEALHEDDVESDDAVLAGLDLDELDNETPPPDESAPKFERRYDDNTPLPDDFEDEEDIEAVPVPPQRRASDELEKRRSELDEVQVDLALGEPEEWVDLLDEVGDPLKESTKDAHARATSGDDVAEDDDEPEPLIDDAEDRDDSIDDLLVLGEEQEQEASEEVLQEAVGAGTNVPVDLDSQFEMQAEAMGLTITGRHDVNEAKEDVADAKSVSAEHAEDAQQVASPLPADEEIELDLSDEDTAAESADQQAATAESGRFDSVHLSELEAATADAEVLVDDELIIDSINDESQEVDIVDTLAEQEDDDVSFDEEHDASPDEDEDPVDLESSGEFEARISEAEKALGMDEDRGDEEDFDQVLDTGEEADFDQILDTGEEADFDQMLDIGDEVETEDSAEDEIEKVLDEAYTNLTATSSDLHQEVAIDSNEDDEAPVEEQEFDLAATMAMEAEKLFQEDPDSIETIVMEGDFVRGSLEMEESKADKEASAQFKDPGFLKDTYATNRDKLRGGRRITDPPTPVMIAAAVVLGLLLLGQMVHGSRQSLSTSGAFNNTIAPVYRMLGSPVTPEWDVKGWQFEATSGATDENEEVLSIFSRIANRSDDDLPYPLVHVSLTDRWEEIIGSRVLEPGEYLAGDQDPSQPVRPGDTFTAVITIESPSVDATGFKLNVCYRVSPGTVRCAIEDFKN